MLGPRIDDDGPATQVVPRCATGPGPTARPETWPRVRGYDVLAIIGAGGMGIVYKARHRELNRVVALKMLRGGDLDGSEFRERFQSEAEAVARLQHSNIIQLFEIGTVEPPLARLIPVHSLLWNSLTAAAFVRHRVASDGTVCRSPCRKTRASAVASAHRVGVVHRDLKPANVLMTADGEPKIADFGLAKHLRTEREDSGRFATIAGMVIGTPEYMSPEQARGDTPTPAFDIYSLGVILYELLTGRVPYGAATRMETMKLLLDQEPVPPRRSTELAKRPRNDLSEVPGEEPEQSLRVGRGPCRRSAAISRRPHHQGDGPLWVLAAGCNGGRSETRSPRV